MNLSCAGPCAMYLPIAMLPSIVWLLFFVFQDTHREKARNILKVFLWGIFIAAPVVIIEDELRRYFLSPESPFALFAITATLYGFVGVAFVEEVAKYLVVRVKAIPYSFFDEPQDAIIYMITAALGFAAIENVAYAANLASSAQDIIEIAAFRGITATFLHAAASGVLGYFLAIAVFDKTAERKKFLFTGILAATVLHGIYNNFIIEIGNIINEFECIGSSSINGCPESLFGIMLLALLLMVSGTIMTIGLHKLSKTRFINN